MRQYRDDAETDPREIARNQQIQRDREASRLLPRFTVHGLVTVTALLESEVVGAGVAAAIGYRQNFTPFFGLHVRLGAGLSVPQVQSKDTQGNVTSKDDASMGEVHGELIPFVGPFGRFYIGPMLWYSHFGFSKNVLETDDATYVLKDDWKAGVGLDMGVLLLRHEELDVNWRIKSTANDQIPVRVEVGVGYHFM